MSLIDRINDLAARVAQEINAVRSEIPAGGGGSSVPVERFVAGSAQGTGDGTSAANAAALSGLEAQMAAVGAGGIITILDLGSDIDTSAYGPVNLDASASGEPWAPITIRYRKTDGSRGENAIISNRTAWTRPNDPEAATDVSAWTIGNEVFRLVGAENIVFEDMNFRACNSIIEGADAFNGITVRGCQALNVTRLIKTSTLHPVNRLLVEDCEVIGFSKVAVDVEGTGGGNIMVRDCHLDSARQSGAVFSVGISIDGPFDVVTLRDNDIANSHDDRGTSYWNGDGISVEEGTTNVLIEGNSISGCTDGGIDCKSPVTLIDNRIWNCKLPLRVWNTSRSRGNTYGPAFMWGGGSGKQGVIGYHSVNGSVPHLISDSDTFIEDGSGPLFLYSHEAGNPGFLTIRKPIYELTAPPYREYNLTTTAGDVTEDIDEEPSVPEVVQAGAVSRLFLRDVDNGFIDKNQNINLLWTTQEIVDAGFSYDPATGIVTVGAALNGVRAEITAQIYVVEANRSEVILRLERDSGAGFVDVVEASNYNTRNASQDEGSTSIAGYPITLVTGDQWRAYVYVQADGSGVTAKDLGSYLSIRADPL